MSGGRYPTHGEILSRFAADRLLPKPLFRVFQTFLPR